MCSGGFANCEGPWGGGVSLHWGRGWELVFRLQAQVGAQSLSAKATVSHGHGHLCGDPGKGDLPREKANATLETVIWGAVLHHKSAFGHLTICYVAKICRYLSSIFIR